MKNDQITRPPAGAEPDEVSIESVPLYANKKMMIPALSGLLLLVGGVLYWYFAVAGTVYTDDAFIDGHKVTVSSKYLGRIAQLMVDEGDHVKQGQVLLKLDESDLRAQEQQAAASLQFAQQNLELAKVNMTKAEEDYQRSSSQYASNVIPKEQYDHAKKAFEAAQAQNAIATAQVATARAQLGVVRTQLHNIVIEAPMDGVIAKRWAMPGDVVQMGQPVFTLYDQDHLWVTANLEETRFASLKVGTPVSVYVDSLGGRELTEKVIQLGANTASQFSLIPPNNASGNFTKVTQRIPVKISIDAERVKKETGTALLPGMSVEVKLHVKA